MSHMECPLCGEHPAAGLVTCLPCAGVGADGLVFARPGPRGSGESLSSRIRASVARGADAEGLALTAGGHRAIAAVPLAAADAVTSAFENLGIPVQVVANRLIRARLPRGVKVALAAMVMSGMAAGLLAAPTFLAVTPLMAALIVSLALVRLGTPLVSPRASLTLIGSSDAARSVARRLAALPPGRARSLLTRIIGLARALESGARRVDDETTVENLRILVEAAGPVAGELDRVTRIRRVLEDPELDGAPAQEEALAEVRRAEARLEAALSGAADVLGRSHRVDALALRRAGELPRLATEVEGRIRSWDQALKAVDRLVGETPGQRAAAPRVRYMRKR